MENRVLFEPNQKATQADFNNLGIYPQQALDHVVGDLLIPDLAFTGFQVTGTIGGSAVTVANGRLFRAGRVYYNDSEGGVDLALAPLLPPVTERWVAITVYGTELPSQPEARTYLVNVVTRDTQADTKPTVVRRWANVDKVAGAIGTDPARPPGASDVVVVAWVRLNSSGIVEIVRNTAMEAPNLAEEDDRLNALDIWRELIGSILDTLRSDIAGLAARFKGLAQQEFVNYIAADIARVKKRLQLPQAYSAYHADNFLSYEFSDVIHVDWLALVEEGVRFSNANIMDSQLGLLNQYDATVKVADFFVLPNYVEIVRFGNVTQADGWDAQAIATYPYTVVDYIQKTRQRWRWRYGPIFEVCTNWLHAMEDIQNASLSTSGQFDPISGTFRFNNGEIWEVVDSAEYIAGAHQNVRVRAMWKDLVTETYMKQIVSKLQASGSIMGNTFLNSQDGWLTSLDIAFAAKGSTGDVTVLICETAGNGEPDLDAVIARTTILAGDIRLWISGAPVLTKASFVPTFLNAGKRYAFVLITAGNHQVWLARGNKYTQGTLFYITDERWATSDPSRDIAFYANFAKFDSPRVEVAMQPLTLDQGIAAIDILAQAIIPPQCQMKHMINIPAIGWIDLDDAQLLDGESGLSHPLAGLPPLVQYKIILIGTTESMPGFGVGVNSRTRTRRPRSDMRHISEPLTCPSSQKVTVKLRLENWYSTRHTFLIKILTGTGFTTISTPSSRVDTVAPDDPHALTIEAVFNLGAPITTFRTRMEGTTDNIHVLYHVAERVDIETTS